MRIKKLYFFTLLVLIFNSSHAQSISTQAKAHLVSNITIEENTQLNFKNILNQKDSSCVLSKNNNSLEGSACLNSSGERGHYTVSSTPNTTLNISSSTVSLNGIVFVPDVPNRISVSSQGSANFYVGGSLTINEDISDRELNISYTINVNYP